MSQKAHFDFASVLEGRTNLLFLRARQGCSVRACLEDTVYQTAVSTTLTAEHTHLWKR